MVTTWLIAGLALLLVGGTALVAGASAIARRLGVPPLVIGLTVLAFGTSSPELVVNITGAIKGETDLAFGNVAGSNLANLGLVLGLAALIRPVSIEGSIVRRELPLLLLGTCAMLVMMLDGPLRGEPPLLDRADALILLLLFGIFVYTSIGDVVFKQEDALIENVRELEEALPPQPLPALGRGIALTLAGTAGLALGGHLTVVNGAALATSLQVSPVVVGIVIVGIGTSLPELVTSAIAAWRRESDLAVGNVVGSNIFNCLVVLPASALFAPLPIPEGGLTDVFMSLLFAAVIIPIFAFRGGNMGRPSGLAFMAIYLLYLTQRMIG